MKSTEYYDKLAEDYDSLLQSDEESAFVRKEVSGYILSQSGIGSLLDFGGGTGLDLGWLTASKIKVTFLEPSENMRRVAIQKHGKNPLVNFPDGEFSDFTRWKERTFPKQFDAVLANFGVLNSIKEVDLFFGKIHHSLVKEGHLFVNLALRREVNSGGIYQILRRFWPSEKTSVIRHKDFEMTVYFHALEEVRRFASPYFRIAGELPMKKEGFHLFHFLKR